MRIGAGVFLYTGTKVFRLEFHFSPALCAAPFLAKHGFRKQGLTAAPDATGRVAHEGLFCRNFSLAQFLDGDMMGVLVGKIRTAGPSHTLYPMIG
jgi:hypothetical protein